METFEASRERNLNQSTSLQEDSPAPIQATQETAADSTGSTPPSGMKCSELFAWLETEAGCEEFSWRTRQGCLLGGWEMFSEVWPSAGLMLNGKVFRRSPLVPSTNVSESLYWPTLSARDWKGTSAASWRIGNLSPDTLPDAVAASLGLPPEKTAHLTPGFCEEFMGFPAGWSELEP